MKTSKNLNTLFAMAIAGIFITSCEKENYQPAVPSQNAELTIQTNPVNQNGTGCIMVPTYEYNKLPKAPQLTSIQTLPAYFELLCPDIKSQGQEGSCVAWATAYAARSIMERQHSGGSFSNSTNVFSPEYVFNQTKLSSDCSEGSSTVNALNLLMTQGVCTLNQMPVNFGDCSTLPNTAQRNDASHHKILLYGTVTISASDIKDKIYAGYPVIVCGPVDKNFYANTPSNINSYSPLPSDYVGQHCYCVVGWDANRNAFKVMNSWGANWKDHGYGWVHYNIISTLFQQAYTMYTL